VKKDVLIVFNEWRRKIDVQQFEKDRFGLIIAVSPAHIGLTRRVRMYRVSIIKARETFFIAPFRPKRTRIVCVERVGLTLGSVVFMYVARWAYNQTTCEASCTMANGCIRLCEKRRTLISEIVQSFGMEQDPMRTALERPAW